MAKYAKQFTQSDEYVTATPFWNLGIPAILKAYFDYIAVEDIYFKYTQKGPVGLLENKKAACIITRSGEYGKLPMSDFEFGEHYIKLFWRFRDKRFSSIEAEGLDRRGIDSSHILNEAIQKALKLSENFNTSKKKPCDFSRRAFF